MSDTAGPSSSTAENGETGIDVAVEAAKLLGLGRRNLLVGDAPGAVQVLQEACGLLATKYGETGDELGEAYFHYGAALLELGRMESGVLGNALDGVPDAQTDDDDDDDEGDDKVESAEKVQGEEREKVLKEVDDALESIPDEPKKEADKEQDDKKEEEKDENKKEQKEEVIDTDDKKDEEVTFKKSEAKEEKDAKKDEQKDSPKKEQKDVKKEEQKEDSKPSKEDAKAKDDVKDADSKTSEDSEEKEKKDEGAGPSSADDKEDGEVRTDEDTADDEEGDTAEEGEGTEKEEAGEGDDISNFQLCWEILELARVIFGRKDDKEFNLKVSQVHLKLGELGLETEQYSQSIDDFNHCLNIQTKHLEPESRLLAETQYNLGLACGFDKRFTEAITNFEGAKKCIETRIALLEKRVKENKGEGKGKEKADAEDPLVKDQKEISELNDLLPEITAKLEDAKDMKKSSENAASQAIAAAAAEFGLGAGSSSSSSSTNAFGAPSSSSSEPAKPIQVRKAGGGGDAAAPSDISHLVRRKRKTEDEASGESKEADGSTSPTDAKRIKPDEKGDAGKANGHANGHANGTVNGHASQNGHDISPEKQEAKPKTVEKKVNGDAAPSAAMETSS